MRWLAALMAVLLLAGCAEFVRQSAPPGHYVERNQGPYRGRVVDAETGQPIAGAVVVAWWRRQRVVIAHSRTDLYAAREVLTDAEGWFVLHAEDIEEHPPSLLLHPGFSILAAGYGMFPRYGRGTLPEPAGTPLFEGAGGTAALTRQVAPRDRLSALLWPCSLSRRPSREIPNYVRLLNAELITLGVSPYPSIGACE